MFGYSNLLLMLRMLVTTVAGAAIFIVLAVNLVARSSVMVNAQSIMTGATAAASSQLWTDRYPPVVIDGIHDAHWYRSGSVFCTGSNLTTDPWQQVVITLA